METINQFKKNEKVYVIYHNIYLGLLFHLFQPPACGKIICKHWKRKYHLFAKPKIGHEKGLCDWYWVNCVGYIYPVLIPETCIRNLSESINKDNRMFERMGTPDYGNIQRGSYDGLRSNLSEKELYLNI